MADEVTMPDEMRAILDRFWSSALEKRFPNGPSEADLEELFQLINWEGTAQFWLTEDELAEYHRDTEVALQVCDNIARSAEDAARHARMAVFARIITARPEEGA